MQLAGFGRAMILPDGAAGAPAPPADGAPHMPGAGGRRGRAAAGHLAPELFRDGAAVGAASDAYAFGERPGARVRSHTLAVPRGPYCAHVAEYYRRPRGPGPLAPDTGLVPAALPRPKARGPPPPPPPQASSSGRPAPASAPSRASAAAPSSASSARAARGRGSRRERRRRSSGSRATASGPTPARDRRSVTSRAGSARSSTAGAGDSMPAPPAGAAAPFGPAALSNSKRARGALSRAPRNQVQRKTPVTLSRRRCRDDNTASGEALPPRPRAAPGAPPLSNRAACPRAEPSVAGAAGCLPPHLCCRPRAFVNKPAGPLDPCACAWHPVPWRAPVCTYKSVAVAHLTLCLHPTPKRTASTRANAMPRRD